MVLCTLSTHLACSSEHVTKWGSPTGQIEEKKVTFLLDRFKVPESRYKPQKWKVQQISVRYGYPTFFSTPKKYFFALEKRF